ncbi:hypothetical protein CPC08DRAFT_769193 [Agrocybe pediades]|nr:hypothetical protein CPC08DRAFT_769193 [Agrocybe pediades]
MKGVVKKLKVVDRNVYSLLCRYKDAAVFLEKVQEERHRNMDILASQEAASQHEHQATREAMTTMQEKVDAMAARITALENDARKTATSHRELVIAHNKVVKTLDEVISRHDKVCDCVQGLSDAVSQLSDHMEGASMVAAEFEQRIARVEGNVGSENSPVICPPPTPNTASGNTDQRDDAEVTPLARTGVECEPDVEMVDNSACKEDITTDAADAAEAVKVAEDTSSAATESAPVSECLPSTGDAAPMPDATVLLSAPTPAVSIPDAAHVVPADSPVPAPSASASATTPTVPCPSATPPPATSNSTPQSPHATSNPPDVPAPLVMLTATTAAATDTASEQENAAASSQESPVVEVVQPTPTKSPVVLPTPMPPNITSGDFLSAHPPLSGRSRAGSIAARSRSGSATRRSPRFNPPVQEEEVDFEG